MYLKFSAEGGQNKVQGWGFGVYVVGFGLWAVLGNSAAFAGSVL